MFKLDNPLSAYFLGWMYSDGCVHYNKKAQSYSAKLKIKDIDEEILHLFSNITDWTFGNEVSQCKRFRFSYIMTYNKEFVFSLVKLGVLPRKNVDNSYFLYYPEMDKSLYPYFIRGLFDGDGCYYIDFCNRINISLYMSNLSFLKELDLILKENNIYGHLNKRPNNSVYRLRISDQKMALNFKNFVFSDNLNYALSRKKDKILSSKLFKFSYKYPSSVKDRKVLVSTQKGEFLGVWKSCYEIQKLSKDKDFILNTLSEKGKIAGLSSGNISYACRNNKLYKGLQYTYIQAHIKVDELTGNSLEL